MKHSCKALALMSLVLLPAKASALSCAMISIAESCDLRWDRPSALDYNLCLESRKKQKLDEQAIRIELERQLREREMLRQRINSVALQTEDWAQIKTALEEANKKVATLSPIHANIQSTSCLRWME